jgi:hypothetical protein
MFREGRSGQGWATQQPWKQRMKVESKPTDHIYMGSHAAKRTGGGGCHHIYYGGKRRGRYGGLEKHGDRMGG